MSNLDSLTTIKNNHDFDTTFTNEYDENQTAVTLITPTSGKSLKITGVYISTEGATTIGQKIRLYFATSDDTVATIIPAAVSNQASSMVVSPIIVRGAIDETLKITSNLGSGKNYFICINYKQE